mmetsp:Transcript_28666/g.66486  ORF Transcript_28666/g.66486 Transcript_28666/m.66486 type:complete len:195 (-) Transcript_28666:288-872(-)
MQVDDSDMRLMQAAFSEWDATQKGWIHRQVLSSVLLELTAGVPYAGLMSLLDLYDQRKDGMIDYQLFLQSMCSDDPLPRLERGEVPDTAEAPGPLVPAAAATEEAAVPDRASADVQPEEGEASAAEVEAAADAPPAVEEMPATEQDAGEAVADEAADVQPSAPQSTDSFARLTDATAFLIVLYTNLANQQTKEE